MTGYSKILLLTLIITLLYLPTAVSKVTKSPTIQSGKLYLRVFQTSTSQPQLFQLSYDSSVKSQLKLTQNSKIQVEAKMKFGTTLQPELMSVRLIHGKYDKLTQPVKLIYDSESQSFKGIVDLGDPRTIQPYTDTYKLQLIIADERLSANYRNIIANTRITFRHSILQQKIPSKNTAISYTPPNIIQTRAPQQRIDPPVTFTLFIVVVMAVFSLIFLYGLFGYLKVNFQLLPSDGLGLVLNLALIALIGVNLVFLSKFWLQWNFITAIGNMIILVIVTALVANYALLYLKNRN